MLPDKLSSEDRYKINHRIRELVAKLKKVNDEQDQRYGYDRRLTPDEMKWIKEIRELREMRDANDKIQP